VVEIKIPDNIKFHKNISITITAAILPSQRCEEWLLLAQHGCSSFRAAADPYGWLSRCYFLFPTFSF
jgi:hypothetical protein